MVGTSSSDILIFAGEEGIDSENDSVDDGQRALGDAEGLSVTRGEADEFAGGALVPELQDDDSADDEQDATDGGVEEIWKESLCQKTAFQPTALVLTDSLVDWSVDDEPSKDSNQDDGEADEGAVDQHDRVLV